MNVKQKIDKLIEEATLYNHPAIREFKNYMKDVSNEELNPNDPLTQKAAIDWLRTHQKDNNLKLSEQEFKKRFQPFFDLGNGDIAMIDKKTNKPVWLAHDDKRFIVDMTGKKGIL